jgi:hypothetical protein
MYVSYTHFRAKWWAVPVFQYHAIRSYGQAKKSIGLLSIKAWSRDWRNYCTLTVWESKKDMLLFLTKGAHKKAMELSDFMGEGYTTGWQSSTASTRQEAEERLFVKLSAQGRETWL